MLYEIQKRTAVKIQAHYRGYLCRRSLRTAKQEEAVIRIQRGWRRVRERRQARAAKQALREKQARQHQAATTSSPTR
jgi:myosin heavy subunit